MARPPADPSRTPTPERIVASARDVFARDGFSEANLSEIAAGAGIRRPSLLYHFATKDVLYAAVVEQLFDRLRAVLAPAMLEPAPFPEQLERLVRTFATDLTENPSDARLLVREILSTGGPGQALLLEQVAPLLEDVVRFVSTAGGPALRPDLPVQAAVLQVVSSVMLPCAAQEPLRSALWGSPSADRAWDLARAQFLRSEV